MKKILFLVLLFLLQRTVNAEEPSSEKEILKRILDKAVENEELRKEYGFYQENTVKKLTEKGEVKEEEKQTYRTVWIEDHPYAELIRINGKELNSQQKAKQSKRRSEFLKELHKRKENNSENQIEITWEEFYQKYDFTSLPPDGNARYVFAFQPKNTKLQERSRLEKIFNHTTGTFWVDDEYNLLRAEAKLADSVRFGLGILAKVETLQFEYVQQEFQEYWFPASFHLRFEARLALVRTQRQEIQSRFYNFYHRSAADQPVASSR